MLKLSSAAVGKIVLGQDFHHFENADSSLHRLPLAMAEVLAINKKISTMGQWYSHLPFGDPKKMRDLQQVIAGTIVQSMEEAKAAGTEDLPLQEAALKAADVIGKSIGMPLLERHLSNNIQTISTALSIPMENVFRSRISFPH